MYLQVVDEGDPSYIGMVNFCKDWVQEQIRLGRCLIVTKSSYFFKCQGFMHKLNHYLEGFDAGNIEILNAELAIDIMKHYGIGDPVYFKLRYCGNSNDESES
jgi:hypothetical protein